MAQKVSLHSKKYYRVVLETIDPARANPESFAIKLAMASRTSLPRVRQVVRNLPYAIKKGLTVAQANRLKSLVEKCGGRARLETYFLTPGQDDRPSSAGSAIAPLPEEAESASVELGLELEPELDDVTASDEVPEPQPVALAEGPPVEPQTSDSHPQRRASDQPSVGKTIRDYALLIAAGVLVILLAISIVKQ